MATVMPQTWTSLTRKRLPGLRPGSLQMMRALVTPTPSPRPATVANRRL
jgi:hypothetical protein